MDSINSGVVVCLLSGIEGLRVNYFGDREESFR